MTRIHRCVSTRHILLIISIFIFSLFNMPLSPIINMCVNTAFAAPEAFNKTKSTCTNSSLNNTLPCDGEYAYPEMTSGTNFSSFSLEDPVSNPTAVMLKDFSVVDTPFAALGVVLALLLLLCGWLAFKQII